MGSNGIGFLRHRVGHRCRGLLGRGSVRGHRCIRKRLKASAAGTSIANARVCVLQIPSSFEALHAQPKVGHTCLLHQELHILRIQCGAAMRTTPSRPFGQSARTTTASRNASSQYTVMQALAVRQGRNLEHAQAKLPWQAGASPRRLVAQ